MYEEPCLSQKMLDPVIGKVSGHDRSPVWYKVLKLSIQTPVIYQQQSQHVPYPQLYHYHQYYQHESCFYH